MSDDDGSRIQIYGWVALTRQVILRLWDSLVGRCLCSILTADKCSDLRSTGAEGQSDGRAELDSVAEGDSGVLRESSTQV